MPLLLVMEVHCVDDLFVTHLGYAPYRSTNHVPGREGSNLETVIAFQEDLNQTFNLNIRKNIDGC